MVNPIAPWSPPQHPPRTVSAPLPKGLISNCLDAPHAEQHGEERYEPDE
jgi:hypothetical protein